MKTATIHVSFSEEKLAALNLYLGQKSMTVESELQVALDSLYQRHVPAPVRSFVAMRCDDSPEPIVPKRKPKADKPKPVEVTSSEQ